MKLRFNIGLNLQIACFLKSYYEITRELHAVRSTSFREIAMFNSQYAGYDEYPSMHSNQAIEFIKNIKQL